MTRQQHRGVSRACAGILLLLATLAGSAPAWSAGTSPSLALVAADAFASGGGRLVTVDGAFNFDDLVQIPFPAAGLLVVQGSRFARYDVDGGVREGTSSLVTGGVTPAELPALLALGAPAAAPARLLQVRTNRISVVLPPSFTAGAASVLLFAQHEDESFVSNAIGLVLP